MRADMFKVIVERPRKWKDLRGPIRMRRVDTEGPSFISMRDGYGYRALNENLAPLERFLHAQINRPWDKVYSEINETIDARSTVKQHILQHIEDFVAINTWRKDGQIWVAESRGGWGSGPRLSRMSEQRLYVNPDSRLLLVNKFFNPRRATRDLKRASILGGIEKRRRVLSDDTQLICIADIWYRVEVATLPRSRVKSKSCTALCAVRNAHVSLENASTYAGDHTKGNEWLFGKDDLYATSKSQLGKKELRAYGLQSSR